MLSTFWSDRAAVGYWAKLVPPWNERGAGPFARCGLFPACPGITIEGASLAFWVGYAAAGPHVWKGGRAQRIMRPELLL